MIPLFKPSLGEEELDLLREVFQSGWLGLGPRTAEFEGQFADYVGARHAVGLSSCTAALHLSLGLLGLKPGDEVIVPAITFVSTAHAAVYWGARPVFADVQPDTLCIDVKDAQRKITDRTRAILPVHYGGHPCDMDEIHPIAAARGIAVVEDAAHACGASYKGQRVGTLSPLTCFSFHAIKNLSCGDGGMVTTDNEAHATRLREWRWMGISRDTWSRTEQGTTYNWDYAVHELGFKAHLNDIAAAIGLVQLRKLSAANRRRREIAARYNEGLRGTDWIECPPERDGAQSAWHIYHIKVDGRDGLHDYLMDRGITTGVHYRPVHLHPYYQGSGASCPVTERVWGRILSLPMFPDMTDAQVDQVIEAVLSFKR
ncbi:MAG: pyridoxal-5'-phosphate-dependent protein [Candidatus Handelsmanbacteria bacterium RIFCSPLOWO2_12_FULL_64_10]|uniref:Pyridoxal-5'-phosphate-dependent protein n=1 Tax=Handelsmanbacteria sp. (strain RIFCSPLOWO2_12_FULL_64_10) TaxID=1817868 RepID=A0A1F6D5B1_HANXR|nr:MAG: pyridoxal-5'-phosphate-dependent protein [Candidatus Handelsmanbacteria bacterium RIFCSPLOWO2_12_FULL_64_10]